MAVSAAALLALVFVYLGFTPFAQTGQTFTSLPTNRRRGGTATARLPSYVGRPRTR